jgi:Mg2+-importing ATPase
MVAGMSFLSTIGESHRPYNEAEARDGMFAEICRLQPDEACIKLRSGPEGLSSDEAKARLKKFGPNLVARQRKPTIPEEIWNRARNPLNGMLLTLAVVSYFLGDLRAAIVIATMVVLAIATAFIQEHQSNEAAARLRAMVHTTASVRRLPGHPDDAFSCGFPPGI